MANPRLLAKVARLLLLKQGVEAVGVAFCNNASPYSLGNRFTIKEINSKAG